MPPIISPSPPAQPRLEVGQLLTLLEEKDPKLRAFAVRRLLERVDESWSEISESVTAVEALAEDSHFEAQKHASLLTSKLFYHLEEYDDALRYALSSGELFDLDRDDSEYASVIVGRCLETFVKASEEEGVEDDEEEENDDNEMETTVDAASSSLSKHQGKRRRSSSKQQNKTDPRLEAIVEKMIDRCYAQGNFKRAIGVALEAKRLDKLKRAVLQSGDAPAMLTYTLNLLEEVVTHRQFRLKAIAEVVEIFRQSDEREVNYSEWFTCLHSLNRPQDFAALLNKLLESPLPERYLIAFQATFDLLELQDSRFEAAVVSALFPEEPTPDATSEGSATQPQEKVDDVLKARKETLKSILLGGKKAAIFLDFLYKKNGTDQNLLKKFKEATEAGKRNSVLHHAMIVAHGYSQCGTANDTFLRQNLTWLRKAANWAKFGATASIGVVHKGNVSNAMELLRPYLPSEGADQQQNPGGGGNSPYSEGGALFALGLIHSAEGVSPAAKKTSLDFLIANLERSGVIEDEITRDALQYGACMGVGLTSMSSADEALIERLRNVLFTDSAVVGEAAAMAMGLVMLGGGDKHATEIESLLGYAHDTDHEKIIRAVSLTVAIAYYGQEEQADGMIEQLLRDKDHLIRYGGAFAVGLAYVATGNNAAVRRLLHVAVSDVSNDVRRAAVISLGLVMMSLPSRLPGLIALLSESYNPHVRYGACIALGLGCSTESTPSLEALELLEPLLDDKVDFVRQGAMIACAILLAQVKPAPTASSSAPSPNSSSTSSPNPAPTSSSSPPTTSTATTYTPTEVEALAKRFREKIASVAGDTKQSSTMSRLGAVLAWGIVDAGGRNSFFSLKGRSGYAKPPAVVGAVLWLQYWYFYPLMHMLALTLTPSVCVGVREDLCLPKSFRLQIAGSTSTAASGSGGLSASRFSFPDPVEEKKEVEAKRVKTAVLSSSASMAARAKQKKSAAEAAATGETEAKPNDKAAATTTTTSTPPLKLVDEEALLSNPIRVTKAMNEVVRFRSDIRYVPVVDNPRSKIGVLMLRENANFAPASTSNGEKDDDIMKVAVPPTGDIDPNEPEPPEPFEWVAPDPNATAGKGDGDKKPSSSSEEGGSAAKME